MIWKEKEIYLFITGINLKYLNWYIDGYQTVLKLDESLVMQPFLKNKQLKLLPILFPSFVKLQFQQQTVQTH
jgi:hypothetical protein